MNGKLASLWCLVGGALMASALMLGGCVAEAGDDEEVGETQAALNPDPDPTGGLVGVADPGQGVILEAPTGTDPGGDANGDSSDGDSSNDGCEPEPNPWVPDPQQQPGGSGDPGPQQGPMGPQGQIKH